VNRELPANVIVLTRGGGSLEDLWPFNQEEVAYAIRKSRIPVVSAVGHEVDLTISDLAADLRAPTPSAVAELVIREQETLERNLRNISSSLENAFHRILARAKDRVTYLSSRMRDPRRALADMWLRLDDMHNRMLMRVGQNAQDHRKTLKAVSDTLILNSPLHAVRMRSQELLFHRRSLAQALGRSLEGKKRDVRSLVDKLNSLSPLSILKRGYSITRKIPDMIVVKDSGQVKTGDEVRVLLARGTVDCHVQKTQPGK